MKSNPSPALILTALVSCLNAPAADADQAQALPAACGKPPAAEQLAAIKHTSRELSRQEVDALLADSGHVVVVDVRRPDEVTTCGGFPVYLSIQLKDFESSLSFIPRDRRIITVSNHAFRAWRSADLLASKGFDVVGAVSAENYAAAGGTALTRIVPPQRTAAGTAAALAAPGAEGTGAIAGTSR